jgi:hypothetical protein
MPLDGLREQSVESAHQPCGRHHLANSQQCATDIRHGSGTRIVVNRKALVGQPEDGRLRAFAAKVRGFLRGHQHDGEFVARCDHAAASQRLIPTESMNILSYDVCHCFAGYFFVNFDPHTIDRNFIARTVNHAAIEHVADSN